MRFPTYYWFRCHYPLITYLTKFITLQNLPQTSTPVVPDKTPPFLVVQVSSGHNSIKFVHLQIGAKKEDYGNLLNNYYDVKNYCDTFIFHFEWKLGHPMICGRNSNDLNSMLSY